MTGESVAPGVDIGELYRLKERRFPVLTDPATVPTSEVAFGEDDWVLGLAGPWGAKAYPVSALAEHHIVNDTTDEPVLVTFCIMCSSGLCFDPVVGSRRLIFDVFGHYHLNMAMDDHHTGTVWSQMDGAAIVGELVGTTLPWVASETVPARRWLDQHPDSLTPAAMRPGQRSDLATLGLSVRDSRENPLVLGVVVDGRPIAYRMGDRPSQPRVASDTVGSVEIVFLAEAQAMPAVYRRELGGRLLDFEIEQDGIVGGGSHWSGGGLALDGPLEGQQLDVVPSRMTRRLQWKLFHPDSEFRALGAPGR